MNKKELENEIYEIAEFLGCNTTELTSEIMRLLPDVLKEILPEKECGDYELYNSGWNECIRLTTIKIKDLYNITL